jgi:hypothetical protein
MSCDINSFRCCNDQIIDGADQHVCGVDDHAADHFWDLAASRDLCRIGIGKRVCVYSDAVGARDQVP